MTAIRIHIDVGPICWQVVSMVQPNVDHDEDGDLEVVDVESVNSIGFKRNVEEDEDD